MILIQFDISSGLIWDDIILISRTIIHIIHILTYTVYYLFAYHYQTHENMHGVWKNQHLPHITFQQQLKPNYGSSKDLIF